MELLIAGAYAVSKRIKIRKAEKTEAKRQGYEDRYKELMEEHDQHHLQKTHSRSQSLSHGHEGAIGDENEPEIAAVSRSQTWAGMGSRQGQGQGRTASVPTHMYTHDQTYTHARTKSSTSNSETYFDSNCGLQTRESRISQETSADPRKYEDDNDDGPSRWVNDVVLERTRSRSVPNS